MRWKQLDFSAVLWTAVILQLLSFQRNWVRATDFDDDDDSVVINLDKDEEKPVRIDSELEYKSPQFDPDKFYFVEHFDDIEKSSKRWIKSQAKKDDIAEEISKYDGVWSWEPPQRIVSDKDIGLVLKSKAKHAAIAAPFSRTFTFKEDKPLVVQYEVNMQDGQDCGGSYIKLLSVDNKNADLTKLNDKSPYTIMFGPDKCGNDYKLHFIFRHVNPINGSISEKHCHRPKERVETPFKDKLPHLYTLIVKPDNSFEIRLDHKVINSGSLLTEFHPPVNPPREIDDPKDKKPDDWDEREKIPDPTAKKPEDWDEDAPPQIPDADAVKPDGWLDDEPETIPDDTALKPADWDTDMDGEWEPPKIENPVCEQAPGCGQWKAPLIPNKNYKGKWRAPLIDNPEYKGKWSARKIPNPDFFEDLTPFRMTPINAIGIELWSISSDILFDNIIVTDDVAVAEDFAAKSFDIKRQYIENKSQSFFGMILSYVTESPLVWKIAIVPIVTLLAFLMYRLFSSGKKDSVSDDSKKTDALQEDVQPSNDESENANLPRKAKKSDLDIKVDEIVDKNDEEPAEEDVSEEEKSKESSAEVSNEEDEVEPVQEETATKSGVPRKRRIPKDKS